MFAQPAPRPVKDMPPAWRHHLLRVYPYAARNHVAMRDVSRMRPRMQLHQMERGGGIFNQLAGGKPDWTKGFEADLERAVTDRRMELGLRSDDDDVEYRAATNPVALIPPTVIDMAIRAAGAKRPDLFEPPDGRYWPHAPTNIVVPSVAEYFMTLRDMRRWTADGYAGLIGAGTRKALFGLKELVVLGVWLEMPAEERQRAWGDPV